MGVRADGRLLVTLRLDHVFCFVDDPDDAVARIEAAGYALDAGITHPGQGTRNRRLIFAEQYLELIWVHDPAEAAANPLRLDRRAAWAETGASPLGIAFLGRPEDTSGYWLYDALGFPIWVREADERAPLVFTLDVAPRDRPRPFARAARGHHRRACPARAAGVRRAAGDVQRRPARARARPERGSAGGRQPAADGARFLTFAAGSNGGQGEGPDRRGGIECRLVHTYGAQVVA